MMAPQKILMACANHWTSPYQVGSHQLAREFVRRGYEVAFISDPISPAHALRPGGGLGERFRIYSRGGIRDLGGRLWAYVPGALLTPHNQPLLKSKWVQDYWHHLTYPSLLFKTFQQGFGEVDLLYLDSVAQSFWLKYIRAKKSIFRIADNNSGFDKSTGASRAAEKELAQGVDAVVYTAESLRGLVSSLEPRAMFHLPNGVNFQHFQEAPREKPEEYSGVAGPIVVYVGALERWFDRDLLFRTAEKMPKVSFFIIGKGEVGQGAQCPKNVRFLGTRPYGRIPAYLWNADAGVIPFNVRKYPGLVNSIHPLKLYEYMACGLPVAAVEWGELKKVKSPALLSHDAASFAVNLEKLLREKPGGKRYVQYAKKQDWSGRMDHLLEFIGGLP